jgi:hypothetical protein
MSSASSNTTLVANNRASLTGSGKHPTWDPHSTTVPANSETTSSSSNLLIPSSQHNKSESDHHSKEVTNNKKKEHKRSFSLGSRSADKNSNKKDKDHKERDKYVDDPVKLLGSPCCPRLEDVPILEPLVCKKISHERLTALVFREDCFVAACQEGYVSTWARPGHGVSLSACSTISESGNLCLHVSNSLEQSVVPE